MQYFVYKDPLRAKIFQNDLRGSYFLESLGICSKYTCNTDRQTDRQTDGNGISIAERFHVTLANTCLSVALLQYYIKSLFTIVRQPWFMFNHVAVVEL